MKKVVCFGGGNAMPNAVLYELKKYPVQITTVASMVDNGGSTGQLRKDFAVLPPGDIRRHLLALSEAPDWKRELWNFRFGHEVFDGGHKGHNFANVFIGGLEYAIKDYSNVLRIIHEFLEVKKHRALPAITGKAQLAAILENGKTISGESEIDVPRKHNPNLKIRKIYLKPKMQAYPPVLKALGMLTKTDLITIGPGDLYSSLLPCFLPDGISDAIKESKAKKIFICNVMTKLGETNNFSVSDFVSETEKYINCELDLVVYNKQLISSGEIKKCRKENSSILKMVKINDKLNKNKFIGTKILDKKELAVYDSFKLVKLIMSKSS